MKSNPSCNNKAEEHNATAATARRQPCVPVRPAHATARHRSDAPECRRTAAPYCPRRLLSRRKAACGAHTGVPAVSSGAAQHRAGDSLLHPLARDVHCRPCDPQGNPRAAADTVSRANRVSHCVVPAPPLGPAAGCASSDGDGHGGRRLAWGGGKRRQDKSSSTQSAQDRMQPCLKTARREDVAVPCRCRAQQRSRPRQ
jgi:hypothetical protein